MRYHRSIIIVSSLVLLGVDRWLKSLASSGMTSQLPFGQFVLFKNYGIIFSWPLPHDVATALMLVAFVVVAWLFYQSWRSPSRHKIIATQLLMIGATSNIYDRLVYGYIIDWAYLGQWWPVFNLADVFIAVGLIIYLTSSKKDVT